MVKVKLDAPTGNELPQKVLKTLVFKHQPRRFRCSSFGSETSERLVMELGDGKNRELNY
jgi:hypothetical protein